MSNQSLATSPEEQRALERFYFHEARLLDNRQYQQWLGLVSEQVSYLMPSRVNVQVDNRARGNEDMISVERELEGQESMGCPIREETYIHLMVRVERAYKINSWSENPPARTRRIVGNIELMAREGDSFSVLSNFHLYYARPGNEDVIYSGQRRDTLLSQEEGFHIGRREVVMDYANIAMPTLGLLF
jgi:3-phenylpropionate/cinnamic acid dioxygenase small subunit|tara:strand:- start:758 stop:1318 length:561 start_codon:yes stop_codon:yes gene_type:complete